MRARQAARSSGPGTRTWRPSWACPPRRSGRTPTRRARGPRARRSLPRPSDPCGGRRSRRRRAPRRPRGRPTGSVRDRMRNACPALDLALLVDDVPPRGEGLAHHVIGRAHLLEAHDVGSGAVEPLLKTLAKGGTHPIDVDGDDAHADSLPRRSDAPISPLDARRTPPRWRAASRASSGPLRQGLASTTRPSRAPRWRYLRPPSTCP